MLMVSSLSYGGFLAFCNSILMLVFLFIAYAVFVVVRLRHDLPVKYICGIFGGFYISCAAVFLVDVLFGSTLAPLLSSIVHLISLIASLAVCFYIIPLTKLVLKVTTLDRLQSEESRSIELERALQMSELKSRSIALLAPNSQLVIDDLGQIIFANRAVISLTFYTHEELLIKNIADLIPSLKTQDLGAGSEYSVDFSDRKVYSELFLLRKDGKNLPIELYSSSWIFSDQVYHTLVIKDLTETLLLEAQKDRFFTVSLDPLCVFDIKFHFLRMNPAWEQILGYSLQEFQQKRLLDLVHPDDLFSLRQDLQRLVLGTPVRGVEYRFACKDGSYRWILWSLIFYPDDRKVFGSARDITDRKLMEEKLKLSNESLEQFAYAASHDLQEPLRTIGNYAQLLERRCKEKLVDDEHQLLHYLVDGTRRMSALVSDLLIYSRATTRLRDPQLIDLEAIISEILEGFSVTIKEIDATITKDRLPQVMADPVHIRQVFQNIISNALKFRRPDVKCHVHIAVFDEGPDWHFMISDNGIGIKSEHIDQLFILFKRLNPRDSYPGTGVGLALCKKVLSRIGGKVWVSSVFGQGSSFHFTFPKSGSPNV